MLTLKEELFIWLHYSSKEEALAKLHPSTSELIGVGGILAELVLAGRVRMEEDHLVVADTSSVGDAILDDALQMLPTQPINLTNVDWVKHIGRKIPLGHRVLDNLVEKGILSREEKSAMFGLSRSIIFPVKAGVMDQLMEREQKVMVHGAKPDPHTAALLFMAGVWNNTSLSKLSGQDKKAHQKRWDALFSDYWGEYPVDYEMEAIEGLDPVARKTIGSIAVAWVSAQAGYVAADFRLWHYIGRIDVA